MKRSETTPGDLISSDVSDSNVLQHMMQIGQTGIKPKLQPLMDDDDDEDIFPMTTLCSQSSVPKNEGMSFMVDGVFLPPPALQRSSNYSSSGAKL